jgi:hypothetical protein
MNLPVLVEPIGNGEFRARCGEPLPLEATGASRDEALARLRALVQASVAGGKELVSLPVGASEENLPAGAGIFEGDPLFDEWQQAIADHRCQNDGQ